MSKPKKTNDFVFAFAIVAFKAFVKWMLFLCVGVIFYFAAVAAAAAVYMLAVCI